MTSVEASFEKIIKAAICPSGLNRTTDAAGNLVFIAAKPGRHVLQISVSNAGSLGIHRVVTSPFCTGVSIPFQYFCHDISVDLGAPKGLDELNKLLNQSATDAGW